jgi:hypothetical protein
MEAELKGIVPAVVLLQLENHLKQISNNSNARIHDYFQELVRRHNYRWLALI